MSRVKTKWRSLIRDCRQLYVQVLVKYHIVQVQVVQTIDWQDDEIHSEQHVRNRCSSHYDDDVPVRRIRTLSATLCFFFRCSDDLCPSFCGPYFFLSGFSFLPRVVLLFWALHFFVLVSRNVSNFCIGLKYTMDEQCIIAPGSRCIRYYTILLVLAF